MICLVGFSSIQNAVEFLAAFEERQALNFLLITLLVYGNIMPDVHAGKDCFVPAVAKLRQKH